MLFSFNVRDFGEICRQDLKLEMSFIYWDGALNSEALLLMMTKWVLQGTPDDHF